MWRIRIGTVLAVALALAGLTAAGPAASAQSTRDVGVRDRLIADQENLLNTYRCRFSVDVHAVPGGCPNPDAVSPGVAPPNPSQQDIDVRDGLIQSQEGLLNVYRCRFGIDTEVVPGGCPERASSQSIPDSGPTPVHATAKSYSDVPADSPQAKSIDRLRRDGILAGTDCADGQFCPDEPVDGLTFATWLTRVLDNPSSADPISRLVELGVAADCADQHMGLCADGAVPRNQMATFFARAFELEEANPARLVDVKSDNPHHDNISRLMATTIDPDCAYHQQHPSCRLVVTTIDPGCSYPSRFCPEEVVTRAQMADLLSRAIDWQEARAEVAVTGTEEAISLTVTYDEEERKATVSWRKPPASNGRVDHYIVQSRTMLESFGPRFYQLVEAEGGKTNHRVIASNTPSVNHLYAFRLIAVYANGERLTTEEVKTPSNARKVRDVIWNRVVGPNQGEHPWLADAWIHMNEAGRFGIGLGPSRVTSSSDYPYPNGLRRTFVHNLSLTRFVLESQYRVAPLLIEEMGHVYTLTNDINENPAPIAIGHLYLHLLRINHGSKATNPVRCGATELYGDLGKLVFGERYSRFDAYRGLRGSVSDGFSMGEWRSCGFRLDQATKSRVEREVPAIARSVFIDQEMPQWFYDTYQKSDETIDLERLWSDITIDKRYKREMNLIAYHLRNEFGGYCSQEQVRKFIEGKATGITNPWKDGGCEDEVVIEEETRTPIINPDQPYDVAELMRSGNYGSYPLVFLQMLGNRPSSCWIAVDGYVFDITPGDNGYEYPGPGQLADLCGRDVSEHFSSNNLELPPAMYLRGGLIQ